MAIKTFTSSTLSSADTNTYLANAGLVYITATSYTTATTVNINNCFSSTMDNYRIMIASTNGSVDGQIRLRMRVGGVDASGATDYDYSASQYNYGTMLNLGSSTGDSSAVIGYKVASYPSSMSLDIYNPFIARNTLFSGVGQYTGLILGAGGQHKQAVSYDGFSLISGAGNMTGIVTIMGYRKA